MKETRVYCDSCGKELTEYWPGEDYTIVPVREAVKQHHDESEEEVREYHLCADEVEPHEFRSSRLFRADDRVPMMLDARMAYQYVPRDQFNDRYAKIAEVMEDVWADE